jgi:hypothetical protein
VTLAGSKCTNVSSSAVLASRACAPHATINCVVVLLGNPHVGKSNLLSRLNKDAFSDENSNTVGIEFVTKTMSVDGEDVKAQVWLAGNLASLANETATRACVLVDLGHGGPGALLEHDGDVLPKSERGPASVFTVR